MKKSLTDQEFQAAIALLDVSEQTKTIAYGVLVKQKPHSEYAKLYNLTKGAISQAVNRVWQAHKKASVPAGFEEVTALLPSYQAYQVKVWAKRAKKLLGEE